MRNQPMKRDLLDVNDLSVDELTRVLDLSELSDHPTPLDGQGAALLFEKPSARTRTSIEMAVMQLGGHPVTLKNDEIGIDTRESAEDLARLFSGYASFIAARVFEHSKLERLAANATIPVVNLLSDDAHPVQALADLLTMREEFGRIEGLRVAYVGDANNVARSLVIGASMLGASCVVSSPPGYDFDDVDSAILGSTAPTLEIIGDPADAVRGADVIYTDAWYSMGQEDEATVRRAAFADWQVNASLISAAGDGAVFMHCLPAHRGDEVTAEVIDGPASRVWPQAHNRMHSIRGLLLWLDEVGALPKGQRGGRTSVGQQGGLQGGQSSGLS